MYVQVKMCFVQQIETKADPQTAASVEISLKTMVMKSSKD